ncbi:hypothetical protein [Thermosyntropha sp.]|uniref:CBU_0592 family membrane protein n=1 Tax=Thermosyntropha sp. TaxID=2740820 RepID=UPI0025DD67C0|nr:hypothetical protein [Thermosyntropha sp.]MBO8159588.1 hypothetical protein [Thermosyntropha sp.]
MIQIISVFGAVLVLAAFALLQLGKISNESHLYNFMNFFGAGILALIAAIEAQWGFLLLEGTWTLVSIYALIKFWKK